MSEDNEICRKTCRDCHSVWETATTCYDVCCFIGNIGHAIRSTVGYFSMKT